MRIGILGFGSVGHRHSNNILSLGAGHQILVYEPITPHTNPRDHIINWAEAVIVCSPSQYHAQDLMDVVSAGKHVLVEKPFGYDCPPLLEGFVGGSRSKNPNLIIATGFNCRYHRCVKHAKEILSHGTIGNIRAASFSVNQLSTKEPYLRDGVIRNWLSHEIDIAHHLLGEGKVISCTADDQREANIRMMFNHVTDVYINGDYITTPHQRFFWIEGDKGSIHANLETDQLYLKTDKGIESCFVSSSMDIWDHTYVDEMKDFIASIEGAKHISPLATGEDGVRALYTVMAAREAAGI